MGNRFALSCFLLVVEATTSSFSNGCCASALDQGGYTDIRQAQVDGANAPASPTPEIQEKQSPPELTGTIGCKSLESAALMHGLPLEFFRRLIWQESNCDPNSVSRAGALGVAQFMPGTARWRGLSDPLEPTEALNESARWLRELSDQFGNLGLAAAAYNAGPRRVKDWIEGRGRLPNETRAYVRVITGRSVEEWIGTSSELPRIERPATAKADDHGAAMNADIAPWGIQLISDGSESKALSEYAQLQKRYHSILSDRAPTIIKKPLGGRGPSTWYFIRVAESSRERAVQLCAKLSSAGGSCLLSRN
jgi:hypothetical protein